jgi:hypothetical protein
MIGLDFFIASFAIGVGGVGWTLQGEVFPTAVRGQAAAFCAMIDWLANFALIEVFPVWQNAISRGGVMICFAGLALAAIAFVYWFLPETKGLPVEEIVRVFERQKGTAAAVTHATTRLSAWPPERPAALPVRPHNCGSRWIGELPVNAAPVRSHNYVT